ncbi:MAG: hypothetical protein AAF362_14990 [Pseudomonadota bacterium]
MTDLSTLSRRFQGGYDAVKYHTYTPHYDEDMLYDFEYDLHTDMDFYDCDPSTTADAISSATDEANHGQDNELSVVAPAVSDKVIADDIIIDVTIAIEADKVEKQDIATTADHMLEMDDAAIPLAGGIQDAGKDIIEHDNINDDTNAADDKNFGTFNIAVITGNDTTTTNNYETPSPTNADSIDIDFKSIVERL